MTSTAPCPRKFGVERKALKLSCAAAAIGCVLAQPHEANAQAAPSGAFQGDITGTNGVINQNRTSNTAFDPIRIPPGL